MKQPLQEKCNKENYKPKAIDLFSGCGGLTLGLIKAGYNVIGAVEIDSLAVETYRKNHNNIKVWERDIRKLNAEEVLLNIRIQKGELDLLAGCPPCQGFSSIRTKNRKVPVEDSRNSLLFEFLRFIEGLYPKMIMMENVPGLADYEKIDIFYKKLVELGYTYQNKILDASDYNVPQRRKRYILIANRLARKIDFPKPSDNKRTVREAISFLAAPGISGDYLHDIPEKRTQRIMDLIKLIPKDGGSRNSLGEARQLECHKKCRGFNDIYGRMKWDDVSPTITSGCNNPSKGRFLHPEQDRAITLREAALLQTFPLDYHFSTRNGKTGIAKMIGNALPPEFIKNISESLLNDL